MKKAVFAALAAVFAVSEAHAEAAGGGQGPAEQKVDLGDASFSITTGVSWTEGDYGAATDTEIVTVPISARIASGPLSFTANLPYMRIETAGVVLSGIDGTPLVIMPDAGAPRRVFDGLGDLTLGAAYELPLGLRSASAEAFGRVKLPTASASDGILSGETDYEAGLRLSHEAAGIQPFAEVSYRWFGDPAGWELKNGFSTSIGASADLGGAVLIASYDFAQSASRLVDDGHELFTGVSAPVLGGRLRLTGYGTVGLSEGAPGAGLGLLASARF